MHIHKSYTAQSEKWAAHGNVFTKTDVRQWVKLTNTALVKLLHHVYVLISSGMQLNYKQTTKTSVEKTFLQSAI